MVRFRRSLGPLASLGRMVGRLLDTLNEDLVVYKHGKLFGFIPASDYLMNHHESVHHEPHWVQGESHVTTGTK